MDSLLSISRNSDPSPHSQVSPEDNMNPNIQKSILELKIKIPVIQSPSNKSNSLIEMSKPQNLNIALNSANNKIKCASKQITENVTKSRSKSALISNDHNSIKQYHSRKHVSPSLPSDYKIRGSDSISLSSHTYHQILRSRSTII